MGYIESWTPINENRGMCTDEEMMAYLQNMNFIIKLEQHQGPKRTQWNLVLYFDPFPQKYLNYMLRWEAKKSYVWKTVEHSKDNEHPTDWTEEWKFARRKGPYGRGIYMGLKFMNNTNFRGSNIKNYAGMKLHNWKKDGYNRDKILKRYQAKERHWTFMGNNAANCLLGPFQYSPCCRFYAGTRHGNPRTSFNYYKYFTPLTYREAARGYKVLPANYLQYLINNRGGSPKLMRRKGLVGCWLFWNSQQLTTNCYMGRYFHEKKVINIYD